MSSKEPGAEKNTWAEKFDATLMKFDFFLPKLHFLSMGFWLPCVFISASKISDTNRMTSFCKAKKLMKKPSAKKIPTYCESQVIVSRKCANRRPYYSSLAVRSTLTMKIRNTLQFFSDEKYSHSQNRKVCVSQNSKL